MRRDKGCSRPCVVRSSLVAQGREQLQPGIGVEFFGRRHLGKGRFEGRPTTGSPHQASANSTSFAIGRRAHRDRRRIDRSARRHGRLAETFDFS